MRVNTAPRKRNAPRIAEKSAPGFLQWLRGRRCAVPKCDYVGRMEAAHVDYAGGKGMGTKVADRYAVPMCASSEGREGHHAEQHRVGWGPFEHRHSMNALAMSHDYWRVWPGRSVWEERNDV